MTAPPGVIVLTEDLFTDRDGRLRAINMFRPEDWAGPWPQNTCTDTIGNAILRVGVNARALGQVENRAVYD